MNQPSKPIDSADPPTEQNTGPARATDNPEYVQHVRQGMQQYQQHDLSGALREFNLALVAVPGDPGVQLLRGVVLRELGEEDAAERALGEIVDQPDVAAQALTNLGLIARRRNEIAAAEKYFRDAIAKNFQFAPAHFQLAIVLLEQGMYREGFREYEWRWHTPFFNKFPSAHPRWDGQPLDGTLLVHTEQGTEDTIDFCRYLPQIRQRCRRLILVCSERMKSLFPAPDWADEIHFPGEIATDAFQAYLPLLSAPLIFQTDLDSIPADVPYLQPPAGNTTWDLPRDVKDRLRVAVAWGEGPADIADSQRYCSLPDLIPILQIPQIAFYSLQQGPAAQDLERLSSSIPNLQTIANLPDDLAEMTRLIKQFDLLVSMDTTIAHLAGAMGIPTWILLGPRSHWRWMRGRPDSPWYPTVRLFRQESENGWSDPVDQVANELAVLAEDRSRRPTPHSG